jgi:hypothetical protein
MLLRLQRIAVTASALSVAVFFTVLTSRLPRLLLHADGALTRFEVVESKANATLTNLDNGTKVWASSAKAQVGIVEDLATDAHGTLAGANAALYTINDSAHTLNDNLAALHETEDAATALLRSTTIDVDYLGKPIQGLNGLVLNANDAADQVNQLLKRRAVEQTLDHLAGITAHLDGISADGQAVTDKLTTDFLAPKPWYRKAGRFASDAFDYGALAARHIP